MILLYARILERGYVEGGSGYSFGLTISQSAHCLGELWNYSLRERIRLRFIDIGGGLVGFMRDARCGRLPSYGFTFGVFDCLVFDFVLFSDCIWLMPFCRLVVKALDVTILYTRNNYFSGNFSVS